MSNDFREYSAAFHYQNNDLMHFGIKGMKWGVRRYQNKDGSLTEEGMKHYGSVKNAYEQMRKKEKLRGLSYLPSLGVNANTMFKLAKGKNANLGDIALQAGALAPALLADYYGQSKYNKFLKYYAKELNIDPKYIKLRVRGSDIMKKSREAGYRYPSGAKKDGYKSHEYLLGTKKDGYRKHKRPVGTRSSR